jgi:putative ATP-binding cassette transporter
VIIFDEWAADQDPAFREVFYCELLPELRAQGKTLLVISHDDRYFHLADQLIKLERGQIVQHQAPAVAAGLQPVV